MKKLLIIGSTVVDVIINLDQLPTTGGDANIISQKLSLGGCAFNVSDTVRHFQIPYLLFSPIGTGIYGDYIKKEFSARKLPLPPILPSEKNGCCYCFVEADGERTFVCDHGAEYQFQQEWFDQIDASEFDSVYLCGLEVEETSGPRIIDFVEKHHFSSLFFAPGPRITQIPSDRIKRLFALHPILHLNEDEALRFTNATTIEDAAKCITDQTQNSLVITLGSKGAYVYTPSKENDSSQQAGTLIPTIPATPVDTIGAGDSHIGAVISCLKHGHSLTEACRIANHISAAVIQQQGALLQDTDFAKALTLAKPDSLSKTL